MSLIYCVTFVINKQTCVYLLIGTPALLGNALSANNEFTVQILGINTSPVLLMSNSNEDSHVLTLYREENDSIASIMVTVYSYDVDKDDRVHFRYVRIHVHLNS